MVAPQALALLNNEFTHQASEKLAAQILREPRDKNMDPWRLILGRKASPDEQFALVVFLNEQQNLFESNPATKKDAERLAWASLCHVLLNTNELIYVD